MSNIYKLLDKLERIVLEAIPIFFTNRVIINNEKIIDTADKIRASIPSEIQEAHNILKRRDEILIEAQKRANQMLADTKQQASMLLSESELLKAVQGEAEKIRQQVIADCEFMKKQAQEEAEMIKYNAIHESSGMKEGAEKYVESVLASLDKDLVEIHTVLRNGQKHISKMKAESMTLNNQKLKPSSGNLPPQLK